MMPFRFKKRVYKDIRDAIKTATKEEGFTAFLSIDKERKRIRPTLWENLVVNMLACRFGIAVLPPEKITVPEEEHRLKIFNNPNVALEYGFMYLKGEHDILIITEKSKELPVDIQGMLVEKIDMYDPYKDVYKIVKEWLQSKKQV